MSLEEAKAKWRAKNARAGKAVAVDVDGVGTIYVRSLSVADSDFIAGMKDIDGAGYGFVMAGLLCNADGSRISEDERVEWAEIFATATWDDYIKLTTAARGGTEGDAKGN